MRIFLSVGHSILRSGGTTSAVGKIHEYNYNKALAPYVKRELEALGHSVDIVVCPERKFSVWTQERGYKLPIANSGKYDLVCELHLNASNGEGHGSEVLYYPGDNRGKLIADRGLMVLEKLGFRNRGAKRRGDLYILAKTKPTAVLFETFFCDNVDDCNRATKLGYEKIAKAIAYGLTGQTSRLKETPAVNNYPSPKKEGGYSVKTNTPGDVLNVRISPSLGSKILSTYRHGSKIYVHDVIKNNAGTWYKIEYRKGSFGFVSARYCVGIK